MNIILPVAGLGTRLRPHTWSRPKPLVTVAGKTMIDHVLDRLLPLSIDRVVFITGYLGDQIEEHVRSHYDFDAVFVEQEEQLGQSHAIIEARDMVSGPSIVLFPDMIFEADLKQLETAEVDGGIYVMQVEDPSRFGVAVLEGGRITRLVEKPEEPVSNLAIVGIYYFREVQRLIEAIDRQIDQGMQTKGEYFLADAIQIMLEDGLQFDEYEVSVWEDCGTTDAILNTNRYLLSQMDTTAQRERTVIVPPSFIHDDATVTDSVIGPYASIGAGSTITGSVVRDSIVDTGARVESANLTWSLLGRNAAVSGEPVRLNIGDNSGVDLAWGTDDKNG